MTKCCPTCKRPFAPDFDAGGPVSQRIYDYIAKHPEGVTRYQVIDWVYADRKDGGPEWANGISVMIMALNKKLAERGMKIKSRGGPGSIYRLVSIA